MSMSNEMLPEVGWLSVSGAANWLHVAPVVIRRAIVGGELPAYVKPSTRREGGRPRYRVSKSDLDAWMRSQPSAREAMLDVS